MNNNNKFFIKNKEVAFSIDSNAKEVEKTIWDCCPSCGKPMAIQKGWMVNSDKKKSEFTKAGIMVSRYW